MPENTSPHPGSWIGDLGNEWKTAKPPEKVMIVGAIVAVIFIALYLHGKSQAPNQPGAQDTSGLSGIPANFQQGAPGGTPGGGSTPAPAPAPTPAPKPPTPISGPTKAPVSKQPTTVTKTYAGGTKKPSTTYQVKGVSPALARVSAQRTDILQLRREQLAPKPRLVQTPAQTYLQVGNRKYY